MEFEQLKEMWKGQETENSLLKVQPLLGRKSKSPIAIMKRHLTVELIAVIVLYGMVIVYYLNAFNGKFYSISIMYIFIGLLFCIYYYKKYHLLRDMECMDCQVESNLKKQVSVLDKYVNFYVYAGTAILPVLVIFLYWFENFFVPADSSHIFPLPSSHVSVAKSLLVFLLWMIVPTIIFYYINKWYVKKLYGKHVEQLKQMLLQMEDETQNS